MPELPEVETVKRVLNKLVVNKKISEIAVFCDKIIKNKTPEEFESILVGQKLEIIRRYGKYLFFDFEKNTMVSHLRMEGKYNYFDSDFIKTKHDHIIFYFTDGSVLAYNDTRKFGTMELIDKSAEQSLKSINKLGLEPGNKNLTVEYLQEKLKRRTITIKQFLLDQTIITGLGNIYVDEVLYDSKIHPRTKINKLCKEDLEKIIKNSEIIINKSIELGGTTVKSFTVSGDVDGKFQHELSVYANQGELCYNCNTKIEKIKVGGRGTHFCPTCQVEK